MSWDVVKKAVNTDLNEPLNYLMWINDLAMFGENGYVYNNEKIINELGVKSKAVLDAPLAFNILADRVIFFDTNIGGFLSNSLGEPSLSSLTSSEMIFNNNEHIGDIFSVLTGSDIFVGLTNLENIVASQDAINVIVNSDLAIDIILNSDFAVSRFINSVLARTAIINSTKARVKFANSTKVTLEMLKSQTIMNEFFTSVMLDDIVKSESSMAIISNSESAMNIIANSTAMLEKLFTSWIAREKCWDSEIASSILMNSSNASRTYMLNNLAITKKHAPTAATSNIYVAIANKKVFVLQAQRGSAVPSASYRYIRPSGDIRSGISTTFSDFSDRCQPLEATINAGVGGTNYWIDLKYVLMQE